ncbi:hypothetical protein HOLleu_44019 [Holothuria leucospilota]|uniref:DUF7869 domain-containing protein n=1 Tax=Holothuria leucospilota TaxID=206669 RepID=A0A9Q0YBB0_HOLLE|nr:hypothetical protein HOLleu_44019 [Holothuria leucospilota]
MPRSSALAREKNSIPSGLELLPAYIHFLPVGHTHEDIDQMFSCVARQLRCHNAFTLQDLEHEASISYSPPIKMVQVTMVPNIKEELIKQMAGHFKNHSKAIVV